MSAAKIKFPLIEQGATFKHAFYWFQSDGVTPVDLTACTAKMQIRSVVESTVVILELSTTNGGITITPSTGKIYFEISDEVTATLEPIKNAVYDLEIYHPNGETTRLSQGTVSVSANVTR
ncbi:hypothetical protein FJZ55_09465 [Candidatus Woesearchaeota archaeon]|nr:hypothetical protein [Candidatus Woesearchaeota archaeon]